MIRVKRANVELDVTDEELDTYLALGYDVYNENDVLVKKAVPTGLGELQKAYIEHTEEIKVLKAKIKELESKKSVQEVEKSYADTKDELNLDNAIKKSNKRKK